MPSGKVSMIERDDKGKMDTAVRAIKERQRRLQKKRLEDKLSERLQGAGVIPPVTEWREEDKLKNFSSLAKSVTATSKELDRILVRYQQRADRTPYHSTKLGPRPLRRSSSISVVHAVASLSFLGKRKRQRSSRDDSTQSDPADPVTYENPVVQLAPPQPAANFEEGNIDPSLLSTGQSPPPQPAANSEEGYINPALLTTGQLPAQRPSMPPPVQPEIAPVWDPVNYTFPQQEYRPAIVAQQPGAYYYFGRRLEPNPLLAALPASSRPANWPIHPGAIQPSWPIHQGLIQPGGVIHLGAVPPKCPSHRHDVQRVVDFNTPRPIPAADNTGAQLQPLWLPNEQSPGSSNTRAWVAPDLVATIRGAYKRYWGNESWEKLGRPGGRGYQKTAERAMLRGEKKCKRQHAKMGFGPAQLRRRRIPTLMNEVETAVVEEDDNDVEVRTLIRGFTAVDLGTCN